MTIRSCLFTVRKNFEGFIIKHISKILRKNSFIVIFHAITINIKRPNNKRPDKVGNSKISEYYGIQHDYTFDKGGTNKDEYIYAPKCGTNNYVYDDCTVKITNCGKDKKEEDTSDYNKIKI